MTHYFYYKIRQYTKIKE